MDNDDVKRITETAPGHDFAWLEAWMAGVRDALAACNREVVAAHITYAEDACTALVEYR